MKTAALSGGGAIGDRNATDRDTSTPTGAAAQVAIPDLPGLRARLVGVRALTACMGVFAYVYGRPIDRKQIAGAGGDALLPQWSVKEQARRIAHILTKPGVEEADEVAALTEGSAGTAHVPDRSGGEDTVVGETPAPSGASTSAPASKNGEGKGGAGNSSAGPHIHAPQTESGFQNFSPTKPAPKTEPEVGETARLGEYLISVSRPSREGTPPRYMILDGAGKLQTQSVSGWEGAVSWIRKRAGGELAMGTLEIVRPVRDEFHPVRPDQRRIATGGPDIAVLRGHETERKL